MQLREHIRCVYTLCYEATQLRSWQFVQLRHFLFLLSQRHGTLQACWEACCSAFRLHGSSCSHCGY